MAGVESSRALLERNIIVHSCGACTSARFSGWIISPQRALITTSTPFLPLGRACWSLGITHAQQAATHIMPQHGSRTPRRRERSPSIWPLKGAARLQLNGQVASSSARCSGWCDHLFTAGEGEHATSRCGSRNRTRTCRRPPRAHHEPRTPRQTHEGRFCALTCDVCVLRAWGVMIRRCPLPS
jgi:hypothetical protein